ncbi:MAG: hypothetical protein QOD86_3112 [Miltoncostaeaceae bacterium]|jgi:uncharacterized protein YndB with AHSA1/START domain|nr:hypothetical protein [Miltoncostaeaceae bacterium]
MPGFTEEGTCRAPAVEVWKLLHDPERYMDWWTGTERVDVGEGDVIRYVPDEPGIAWPTAIASSESGGRVTISCILSGIVYDWTLSPRPPGCTVSLHVEIPEELAAKLEGQMRSLRSAFGRLVDLAEREAGG